MNNEDKLHDVLRSVFDPELMVNVVDLGLIYRSEIDEDAKKISIDLTLTSRGCPLGDMIIENAKRTITNNFPGYEAEVMLVWEPAWTPEKMTESARKFLGG